MKKRRFRTNKKGFIFTYDALMAVTLALLFLNMFLAITRPKESTFESLIIYRTANDFLVSGEKSGIFETMDNNIISLFMNQTLADNLHAELNMRIYNRTLSLVDEVNVSRGPDPAQQEYTVARRVILIYNETGNLTDIGLVTLRLWRGDSFA